MEFDGIFDAPEFRAGQIMEDVYQYLNGLAVDFPEKGKTADLYLKDADWNAVVEAAISRNSSEQTVRGALIHLVLLDRDRSYANVKVVLRKGDAEKLRPTIVDLLTYHGTKDHVDTFVYMIERGSMLNRKRLILSLAKITDGTDTRLSTLLHRLLRFGDQHSCLIATLAVKDMRDWQFVDDLIYLLQKEGASIVRLAVVDALKALNRPESLEALRFVADNDRVELVRQGALEALSSISYQT